MGTVKQMKRMKRFYDQSYRWHWSNQMKNSKDCIFLTTKFYLMCLCIMLIFSKLSEKNTITRKLLQTDAIRREKTNEKWTRAAREPQSDGRWTKYPEPPAQPQPVAQLMAHSLCSQGNQWKHLLRTITTLVACHCTQSKQDVCMFCFPNHHHEAIEIQLLHFHVACILLNQGTASKNTTLHSM